MAGTAAAARASASAAALLPPEPAKMDRTTAAMVNLTAAAIYSVSARVCWVQNSDRQRARSFYTAGVGRLSAWN